MTTDLLYSADDVLAAHFAAGIRGMAKTEGNMPRDIIWSFIGSGDTAEDEREFTEEWTKFEHGASILDAGYHVTYSDRHVQMLDAHAEQIEQRGPVSPLVQTSADYVGTTQRYCFMALIRNR